MGRRRQFGIATAALVLAWPLLVGCGKSTGNGGPASGGDGGDDSGSGEGGSSGGAPSSGLGVYELRSSKLRKVDLLLAVDNSASMADKQRLLAQAVPALLERLHTPRCVEPCTGSSCSPSELRDGSPVGQNVDANGECPSGSKPELTPIHDLHLAVISSSLGSHGAVAPNAVCTAPSENDHAQLLGTLRGVSGTYDDHGFLAWDAQGVATPPGSSDAAAFADKAAELIESAGENGCSQPATLEAWYRFLIDPEPPASIVISATGQAEVQGIDTTVLDQRAAFLRPDSLLIIGLLSDGNDCSLVDEGYGWLAARHDPMFRSTSVCSTNPNHPCCQSCGETTENAGCSPPRNDAACAQDINLTPAEDDINLRCWEQKRRFGFELLYPIARYTDALRSPTVTQRSDGQLVPNPLFVASEGGAPRERHLVRLLAIAGVPWQDIADAESLTSPESLRYLSASELLEEGRWDVILGDPSAAPPILPFDPLMVESLAERGGANPITGDALVPSTAPDSETNPINGREHAATGSELQYACRFPVGPAGPAQTYAKAQPGRRLLQLVKQAGDGATLASVCPKVLDTASDSYGYLPAVDALVSSIRPSFSAPCLPVPLPIDVNDGRIPGCFVVTTLDAAGAACDCEGAGFAEVSDAKLAAEAQSYLRLGQWCDTPGGPSCSSICSCEIPQLEGTDAEQCIYDLAPPRATGYCYVNAEPDEPNVGNPALVADCQTGNKRNVRLTGTPLPAGSHALLFCDEQVFR